MNGQPTTLKATIGPGRILRRGTEQPYQELTLHDGEPHTLRDDLTGAGPVQPADRRRRSPALCFAHVTDFQIADVQSPARFEFFNRYFGDPRVADIVPVQRPQEALAAHAVQAIVNTLNTLGSSPVTGTPLQLVVTTGDGIDNAQWNEMQNFMALLEGGAVHPDSGGSSYEGVQSMSWPDEFFWHPDGSADATTDIWRERYGFPHAPGVLLSALRDFDSQGLKLPWLGCFGNHEALVQGVAPLTRPVLEYLVGGRKPLGLPPGMSLDAANERFAVEPEAFLTGEQMPVSADLHRRGITRTEFVAEHFRPGGRPHGHGFTQDNLRDGTAYYTYDEPHSGIRLIGLDTNDLHGGVSGTIDHHQMQWLEQRLIETHSAHRRADGSQARPGHEDRLVMVFSHHDSETLRGGPGLNSPANPPAPQGSAALISLLHRFPNVVLWLNGHRHINKVRPHRDPAGYGPGFWEVTTCSVMDWPSQTRLIELVDNTDGTLSVLCTMIDHNTPVRPGLADGRTHLASLHRELAANSPWGGHTTAIAGTTRDRNVELLLPGYTAPARHGWGTSAADA
ncbi:TIGR03767 family metallophosphoesterase [Streptomyces sp. NPDC126514]|uniref:TIGR03767 family metallophosphoesterase n=1 Tax=Streptomyces sp. NPDC126514 TaxID=3155210 RepID=UPI0033210CAD